MNQPMTRSILCTLVMCLSAPAALAQALVFVGTGTGPIPDSPGVGPRNYGEPLDISFDVSGLTGNITNVQPSLQANHPFVGDLRVTLIAPDGRSHLLFESTGATAPGNSGGSDSDLVSTNPIAFGDSSPTNWWSAAASGAAQVAGGTYRTVVSGGTGVSNPPPVTSLIETFRTAAPNGRWILRVEDGWTGDTGNVLVSALTLTASQRELLVTNADDSGAGSLRDALSIAQSGDAIRFSTFFDTRRTIFLQSALPLLPDGVSIFGPGADLLNVRRATLPDFRIFELAAGAQATISGLTIERGSVPAQQGGGILSRGRLTVIGSVIRDNVAQGGGGITNLGGNLMLLRSTVVGNSANFGAGVRSRSDISAPIATALIDNSTISAQFGGDLVGINVIAQQGTSSTLVLRNSTVTDTAGPLGSGLWVISQNPGSNASARVSNSLFATGQATITAQSFDGGPPAIVITEGFNLATDNANGLLDRSTDLLNANAPMQPLFDNGGGILLHRPLLTSDALDNGRATGPRLSDQTGIFDRVTDLQDNQYPNAIGGDGSDIGAFELPAAPADEVFANGFE